MALKKFLKKNWSNLLFLVLLALFLIPQTSMPIKVFFNRLVAFNPDEIPADEREIASDLSWELASLDGQSIDLDRSSGKVILVNQWATWCPPCVAELPALQNLYNEYGDKVDFYFVSNESSEKLQSFLQKKDYKLPVYQMRSQPPLNLSSSILPTTWIIAHNGVIVVEETGAVKWDSEETKEILNRLLEQTP